MALHPDVKRRYQTVEALARDLSRTPRGQTRHRKAGHRHLPRPQVSPAPSARDVSGFRRALPGVRSPSGYFSIKARRAEEEARDTLEVTRLLARTLGTVGDSWERLGRVESAGSKEEARSLLDQAASQITELRVEDPRTQATALQSIAQLYFFVGAYQEALPLALRAQGLLQASSDLDLQAAALITLVSIRIRLGHFRVAELRLKEHIPRLRSALGERHPRTLRLTSLHSTALYTSGTSRRGAR